MLEKLFELKNHNTSVRRELVAGFTNFMTISYIIFVQPNFLAAAGMNPGAVMVATWRIQCNRNIPYGVSYELSRRISTRDGA